MISFDRDFIHARHIGALFQSQRMRIIYAIGLALKLLLGKASVIIGFADQQAHWVVLVTEYVSIDLCQSAQNADPHVYGFTDHHSR